MSEPADLIGQIALRKGLVDPDSLARSLALQKEWQKSGKAVRLGEVFVAQGLMQEPIVQKLLSDQQRVREAAPLSSAPQSPAPESSRSSQPANDAPPKRIGEYTLEKPLGKGGMGAVYLARREADNEQIALKVLSPAASEDRELVTRFRREAKFMSTLDHPNLVKAYDVGTADGYHYMSMEYVEGEDLGRRIRRQGRVEPAAALEIMKQVALALEYGAKRGVVHRDLKPENILIRPDGVCKLADMGLAILSNRDDLRLTAEGVVMGTPLYMSPEQASGERNIDTRADIYALGCTFYHAICGEPPFTAKQSMVILQMHLSEIPRRLIDRVPGMRTDFEAVIWRCLQKVRERRYANCAELVSAITNVLAAPPPKQSRRLAAQPRTRKRQASGTRPVAKRERPTTSVKTPATTRVAPTELTQKLPAATHRKDRTLLVLRIVLLVLAILFACLIVLVLWMKD